MRSFVELPGRVRKEGYTRRVNRRDLYAVVVSGATLVFSSPSAAQTPKAPPPTTADVAAAAGQVAKQAAELADQAAEAELPALKPDGADDPVHRARQGVVTLERAGKVLGVGSVLDGDGRILTALSLLGHGNALDARFADGSLMRLKMGHTDRAWDLALLVPQNGRWKQGLRASRTQATEAGSQLRAFRTLGPRAVAPSRVIVKGLRTLLGGDAELLPDAIELGSRFKDTDVGSPILDDHGNVVAVVALACAPDVATECRRTPYGVPVPALKAFLRSVPKNAVAPAPWLGIHGLSGDIGPVRGVRVANVHPASPAAAAGLRAGRDDASSDVVVAVDQLPVTTPEALAESINARAVGDTITLLLYGNGRFRDVSVTLRAAPEAGAGKRKQRAPAPAPGPGPGGVR